MGATDSEMGAPEGLLFVFIIFGLLLGTCLSEQACVDDACFDQSIQQLKIERSKIDQASGLNYRERSTDLVATIDVIGVCLPGVNPNVLADSFQSCSDEKVEEVCTMVKRGWLEDKEGKSVVNENALLATFKGLNGGEDAVRECLQIPELYEYEYYYYDYANYYDEYDYDYLEESASGSRQRRAAGKTKKEGKSRRTQLRKAKKLRGRLQRRQRRKRRKTKRRQEKLVIGAQKIRKERKQKRIKKRKQKRQRQRSLRMVKKTHERRRCQNLA